MLIKLNKWPVDDPINSFHMWQWFGSVGRAVASDSRGLRLEFSHRQIFILNVTVNCIEKTKIKKKRPEMAHF